MKPLREVGARHAGFEDRKPELPPYPPLLPGEDPPPPDYRWVLPLLLTLAILAAIAGVMLFAREAALERSR